MKERYWLMKLTLRMRLLIKFISIVRDEPVSNQILSLKAPTSAPF